MGKLLKLLMTCLIVGLALSFLGIDPIGLWQGIWALLPRTGEFVLTFLEWALPYIFIGAVVVVPLVVVAAVLRVLRRRP